MAFAYWVEGEYRIVAEPTCTTPPAMNERGHIVAGTETWGSHPWASTDPKVPTYQDCPRCGARRVWVPDALAAAAGRLSSS